MRLAPRLWLLARKDRLALAAAILCGFIGGLLTIWQAATISRVVNEVFLGDQALAAENSLFRLLVVIVFFRSMLVWGEEVSATRLAVRIKTSLRQRLFDRLLQLGPLHARGEQTGELANTLLEGVEALGVYFSQYLPQLALAALIPLSILVFIFPRDLLSGVVLLLTAPLIPIFLYLIGKSAEALTRRQWDTLSRLSAYFLDSLQGLTALKELGRSKERAQSIAESNDRFREVTLKVLRITFLSALVLELVATISTAMVAVEVSLRLLYGQLGFQQAFFLLLLAPEFYLPLRMLGTRFHAGMAGTTAARRIFEILDARVERRDEGSLSGQGDVSFSTLRLSNVSYGFPGEGQPVLKDISLKIKAGEHVAVVGPTGAGKTTLAALLLGFIQPDQGQISLDQNSSRDISLERWRGLFAWVPQNPHLFHDSIAANLRIARPEAGLEELESAAKAAFLAEFIHSLPNGYETVVGEEGARLSGGEAQRLALARAFLKDAHILILDEPTSALDPRSESFLEASTRQLMQGRTVITIAHRLNTVYQADHIYVLEGGRLIESGTHKSLLEARGTYSRLVGTRAGLALEARIGGEKGDKSLDANINSGGGNPDSRSYPPMEDFSSSRFRSHTLLRLLSFLRGSWGWVVLSALLGVLTVGSNVGLMGTAAYLISAAALHLEFGALQLAIVGVRFFGISRGVFRYTERLASHDVTFRLLGRLRTWFYQALEPLAPARLMQYRAGDILARIIADVEALENFYVRAVAPPVVAAIIAAGMAIFFSRFDVHLALWYLGIMMILGIGLPWLSWQLSHRRGAELVSRRAAFQSRLVDGIQGLADLLAFNHGREYSLNLEREERAYGQTQEALASISGFSNGLMILLVNFGMLVVLVLSIPLVVTGRLPGVMLAVLALAAQASFEAILPLPTATMAVTSSMQAARRLFEIVDTNPAVVDAPSMINCHSKVPTVEFSQVSFTYPGSDSATVEGIEFSLRTGMRTAIVGPTGAGKSTLSHLLLRYWDYNEGSILLDGRDLHKYGQEVVRRQFSVVSQKSVFFHGTVLQNLRLARPDVSESQVWAAARLAQIDEFITSLPLAYETAIGERGLRLSGGERQRLALARAYLKDAPIYLLDEPTANLDPRTEKLVLEMLLQTTKNRSLLIMTHRLIGLEHFDEIIVLDHGRITERGTHSELLATGGLYCDMWTLQQRLLETITDG